MAKTIFSTGAVLAVLMATAASAQDTPTAQITLELNSAVATAEGGCQVVFLGRNGLEDDLDSVTWRLAVLDAQGVFQNLLALPLGALSAGKRRIVQYNLPAACDGLSEIIVNDVAECKIGGTDSDLCLSSLAVSSRADIAFGL